MGSSAADSALPRFFVDEHGDRRVLLRVPRLSPAPKLYCPLGHSIRRTSFALEEDTYRCEQKLAAGVVCGLYVYVIADFHAAAGTALLLSMEVTSDEIKRFRRLPLLAKLKYLDVMVDEAA